MLVDSHAHLYLDAFDADRDAVVQRARAAGVTRILMPATDLASIDTALELCERYDGLYAQAALHPMYVQDAPADALARIRRHLDDDRVVAVGESGLDGYWSRDHLDLQRRMLRAHAELAAETGLPLVIHNRDVKGSDEIARELVAILQSVAAEAPLRGVFHCFGGPSWLTAEVLDLGFHIGLGGTLTFKNAGVPETVADVPFDRVVLETDAPYLAPTPHRGTRNEPAHTRLVAERLAALRDLSLDVVAAATTAAAEALFGLDPEGAAPARRDVHTAVD